MAQGPTSRQLEVWAAGEVGTGHRSPVLSDWGPWPWPWPAPAPQHKRAAGLRVISRAETSGSRGATRHLSPFFPPHYIASKERGEDNGGKQSEFFKVIGSDWSFHLSGKICLPGGVGDKRSGGLAIQPHPIICQLSRCLSLQPLPCLLSAPASYTGSHELPGRDAAGRTSHHCDDGDRCREFTPHTAGPVLGTRDPEMTRTQLRPHWGEGCHTPVITNSRYCREGKRTRKSGGWGRLHQEKPFLGRTFPRMRVLQNESLCPTKFIC